MRAWMAAGAALLLAACGSGGSKAEPAQPKPATNALSGRVTLSGAGAWMSYGSDDGERCWGEGGYSDVEEGAQVRVLDQNDRTIALGEINESARKNGDWPAPNACELSFTVPKVPRAKFYTVKLAQRNGPTWSHADLEEQLWDVHLTLGQD